MLTQKKSQLGYHDSELAIVMEDKNKVTSKMDGKEFEAGYHAATLRRYLWREHLGLLPMQSMDATEDPNAQPPDVPNDISENKEYEFVADPLSDEVWKMWTERATTNTEIFRHLFHADPDDNGSFPSVYLYWEVLTYMFIVKTFDEYNDFLPRKGIPAGHIYDKFIPVADVRSKLDLIKGHLVWFPLEFLKDAEMAEKGLQVNAYTESIYT